ncbi:spermidine synthase [Glacieibacterium sp.]|uniref:spermidine synthase n=1 Tax=Glacieibacterium sp. TaxID=2860237 RepID=UPI003AFFF914
MDDTVALPRSFSRRLPLRPLFTATVLLGSFLLFMIQPMFGRSVLPVLGGAPSVWNTAMLFYQTVLLLGYLYAHALRHLPLRRQLMLHLVLFVVAGLTLPVAVAQWLPAIGAAPPVLWLLGLLAASIGPVFFVTSAQAPLMQSWFARSGHPLAGNPYFLYAASNFGSFAALIAYPLLIEPALRLGDQARLWSAGFVILALLVAACGYAVRGGTATATAIATVPVTWRQRGRWTLLALVPSGLLLSTTTHLTTDIMAMPLLWVIPLAVYLLSFVLAFGRWGRAFTNWALGGAPLALLLLGGSAFMSIGMVAWMFAAAGVVLLFVVALALHGTLAEERPEAASLTDFYLWISVGGALGGVFCALLAPAVFDWPYEHPLLLIAAAALIPARLLVPLAGRLWSSPVARIVVIVGAPLLSLWIGRAFLSVSSGVAPADSALVALCLLGGTAVLAIGRPLLFAVLFTCVVLAFGGWHQLELSRNGVRERSFFGIYTVEDVRSTNVRHLLHGTTLHGVQSLDPRFVTVPMTYYAPGSGVGLALKAVPPMFGPNARIAFVGLGSGTLSCYAQPGQAWTAYEIDPVIVGIAKRRFSYVSRCRPDLRIVLGDARLTLAAAAPAGLDVLAVDAFSSDAIPLHMVTREAFRVYGRALQRDGVLLLHISNRYLELEPVVAAIAKAEGWTARVHDYTAPKNQPRGVQFTNSSWIVLTRSPQHMDAVVAATPPGSWRPLLEQPGLTAWSDDFASILPVLKRPH